MDLKRMEFKVETDWGRVIKIIVDLQFNGGRVTVEGSQQVIAKYPVEVKFHWTDEQEKFRDTVGVISEQKGNLEPIVTAEICSEKAQGWGVFNRPKLTAFCSEGKSLEGKKPRIDVMTSGNLLGEHGENISVGFTEIAS